MGSISLKTATGLDALTRCHQPVWWELNGSPSALRAAGPEGLNRWILYHQ